MRGFVVIELNIRVVLSAISTYQGRIEKESWLSRLIPAEKGKLDTHRISSNRQQTNYPIATVQKLTGIELLFWWMWKTGRSLLAGPMKSIPKLRNLS